MLSFAVSEQVFELGFGFEHRWLVASLNPPHRKMSLVHRVEPLLAILHDTLVRAFVGVIHQVLGPLPNGDIDEDGRAERANARRVAVLILQSPNKARTRLGEVINLGDLVDEALHRGVMQRRLHLGVVDLREVVLRHLDSLDQCRGLVQSTRAKVFC